MKDKFGIGLQDGDIIDIHQTVNGQNLFVVKSVNPLDIRYNYDLSVKYEYDMGELLIPCKYTGVSFEIISNIYTEYN